MAIMITWKKFKERDPRNAEIMRRLFISMYSLGYDKGKHDTKGDNIDPRSVATEAVTDICNGRDIDRLLEDVFHEVQ